MAFHSPQDRSSHGNGGQRCRTPARARRLGGTGDGGRCLLGGGGEQKQQGKRVITMAVKTASGAMVVTGLQGVDTRIRCATVGEVFEPSFLLE